MMLQCYTSETCPGLKLPSQALEVASTDAVVDMSRAGSLAGNWEPRTSKRFPIAMILPWFCHDVSFQFIHFPWFSSILETTMDRFLIQLYACYNGRWHFNHPGLDHAANGSFWFSEQKVGFNRCAHVNHQLNLQYCLQWMPTLLPLLCHSITMGTCWVFPF